MSRIAVDADLLVYNIGYASERTLDFGDGWVAPVADSHEAEQRLEAEVAKVKEQVEGGEIVFCLSDIESNFRKDLYPPYKANRRVGRSRPLLFDWIRGWICNRGESLILPGLEADDVLGILATEEDAIMVSIDKDLLCVPGTLVNPGQGWSRQVITPEAADRFHLEQTLIGDRVDNYPGCPKVGDATAPRLLKEGTWGEVVAAFERAGLTEEDALVQARLARILRTENYNPTTEEVTLWNP